MAAFPVSERPAKQESIHDAMLHQPHHRGERTDRYQRASQHRGQGSQRAGHHQRMQRDPAHHVERRRDEQQGFKTEISATGAVARVPPQMARPLLGNHQDQDKPVPFGLDWN
jgi:hypothetical protein